jgi:hypothetical protein
MTFILRKLSLASAIVAAATFTAAPALAEISLTVPFSFVAAGKLCPAGHYNVDRNPLNGVITLQSVDASRTFAWVAGPGDPSPADTRVILKFDARGSMRYLHSIQYGPAITTRLDRRAPEYVPSRTVQGQ